MIIKFVMMGKAKTGKTELLNQVVNPNYLNLPGKNYKPTIGADFSSIKVDKNHMQIWDISGEPRYKSIAMPFTKGTDVLLYCVNLAQEITAEELREMIKEINEFRAENPNSKLVLVGTQMDMAPPNALETVREQFKEIPFETYIATSAREPEGAKELRTFITQQNPKTEELEFPSVPRILKARDRCTIGSDLYRALDNLNKKVAGLDQSIITRLGNEAELLLNDLGDPDVTDKAQAINTFEDNCADILQGKHHDAYNAIKTIAATAAVAVIAGLIGFGIGLALGAWTGPGAFFTALAAGSLCAAAVVGGASLIGVGTLLGTQHLFFSRPPAMQAVTEFAEDVNSMYAFGEIRVELEKAIKLS